MRPVFHPHAKIAGWLAVLLTCAVAGVPAAPAAGEVHHYVFFGMDRERIEEPSFLETGAFEGAQLKYSWRQLERGKDQYDFDNIRHDLAFLKSRKKRLFIQLQDVSFDPKIVPVPRYLLSDPEYHGGANPQYTVPGDDETKAEQAGWVARRWDPAVRERFHKLLRALGREFDGKIEGINLPETAVDFGETGRLFPPGFTRRGYRDAVFANMAALKAAFPTSVAMQYANFMFEEPGDTERANLRAVYEKAVELKMGVGGPDLLPWKPGQMRHSYPLLREFAGRVPAGIAVQDGNYAHENPKTGKRVTIPELVDFGTGYLGAKYVFWCTEEPYYSRDVIPFLRARRNTAPAK
jgi:hypothetical protein